jgi:hypothetical protein
MSEEINISDFSVWVTVLKTKIHHARNKLAFSINSQILELYWEMGREVCRETGKVRVGQWFYRSDCCRIEA